MKDFFAKYWKAAVLGAVSTLFAPLHVIVSSVLFFMGLQNFFMELTESPEITRGTDVRAIFRKPLLKPLLFAFFIGTLPRLMPDQFSGSITGAVCVIAGCAVYTVLTGAAQAYCLQRRLSAEYYFLMLFGAAVPGFLIIRIPQFAALFRYVWQGLLYGSVSCAFFTALCGFFAFTRKDLFPLESGKWKRVLQAAVFGICAGSLYCGGKYAGYLVMRSPEAEILTYADSPSFIPDLTEDFHLSYGVILSFRDREIALCIPDQPPSNEKVTEWFRESPDFHKTYVTAFHDGSYVVSPLSDPEKKTVLASQCGEKENYWFWADDDRFFYVRNPRENEMRCHDFGKNTDFEVPSEQFFYSKSADGAIPMVKNGRCRDLRPDGVITEGFEVPQLASGAFYASSAYSKDRAYLICEYYVIRRSIPVRIFLCRRMSDGKMFAWAPFQLKQEIYKTGNDGKMTEESVISSVKTVPQS